MPERSEEFIAINGMDEWESFWAANAHELEGEVGDEATCRGLACNHLLVVGGGAAPVFRVGFVD
jgi:hypothetical protein